MLGQRVSRAYRSLRGVGRGVGATVGDGVGDSEGVAEGDGDGLAVGLGDAEIVGTGDALAEDAGVAIASCEAPGLASGRSNPPRTMRNPNEAARAATRAPAETADMRKNAIIEELPCSIRPIP